MFGRSLSRSCSLMTAVVAIALWQRRARPFHLNRGSRVFYEAAAPFCETGACTTFLGIDTLAELTHAGGKDQPNVTLAACRLTVIKDEADRKQIQSTFPLLKKVSASEMLSLIDVCGKIEERIVQKEASWSLFPHGLVMYPGTLWCGPGDTASNYSELGASIETDRCCRNHDFCPLKIYGGQTKFGLTPAFFKAAMLCECESVFDACLRAAEASEEQAATVRYYYFNIYSPECLTQKDGEYALISYAQTTRP